MPLKWTKKALSDLARLYEFLAAVNPKAAARVLQQLVNAADSLPAHPNRGKRLEEFKPRNVRRILAGHYEIRYEVTDNAIYLLRLWHSREDR